MRIMGLHSVKQDVGARLREINLMRIDKALDALEPDSRQFDDVVRLPLLQNCLCVGFISVENPDRKFTLRGMARLTVQKATDGATVVVDSIHDQTGQPIKPPTIAFRDANLGIEDHPAVQGYDGFKVTISPEEERLWGMVGNFCIPVVPPNAIEVEAFLSPCIGALEHRSRT
ncbi:MAG: hypothetical protein QG553_57 [Patescibacteria group bacterium]|nr:hypothetical protein [Patescibacteria group bacterium]